MPPFVSGEQAVTAGAGGGSTFVVVCCVVGAAVLVWIGTTFVLDRGTVVWAAGAVLVGYVLLVATWCFAAVDAVRDFGAVFAVVLTATAVGLGRGVVAGLRVADVLGVCVAVGRALEVVPADRTPSAAAEHPATMISARPSMLKINNRALRATSTGCSYPSPAVSASRAATGGVSGSVGDVGLWGDCRARVSTNVASCR